MSILELLEAPQRDPETPAVLGVEPDKALSYGALRERMLACGRMLRTHGIGPSDVVLVSMPNGPDFLVAILGVMGAAVCAPMNASYTLGELERLATDVRAAAVLVEAGEKGPPAQLASKAGLPLLTLTPGLPAEDPASLDDPEEDAVALLLHTAGTTAHPKQVPLTHGNLVAAARNVVASLGLTSEDRCLNVMPFFHSHGLLGAALSTLAAGGSIVCTPGMDPRRFFEWAERFGCTWYTAASTIHRLVLESEGSWGGFRFMRSASGPLPPQLARELEARCGAPMIEVYGMTEAYQIAANPLPPGERRFGSVGRATGTVIAILDDAGAIQNRGEGEILVRGPAVFRGYSAPPNANDGAFIDGLFRTGDLGILGPDGYLTITGRAKEQINRAGEKISPREVEEAILEHPGVVEAVAFGVPDQMLGEDIVVAVVLDKGAILDVPALRKELASRLAAYKIPRRILAVPSIPKSDTGKPQRRTLSQAFVEGRLVADGAAAGERIDTASATEERLARIWQSVLKLSSTPSRTDRFFDIGGDSLAVMEMVVCIADEFGVELPLVDVHAVPTLSKLARHIEELMVVGPSDALLVRYQGGSSATNVVLIPGQAGHAVGLDLIADAIGPGPAIYLYDYPGHRPGQMPARTIEAIAARLVDEIAATVSDGPLVLYGNSMGSWVALEAARLLESRGQKPVLVGIGDLYSPYFNTHTTGHRPALGRRLGSLLRRILRRLDRDRALRIGGDTGGSARQREITVGHASSLAQRAYRPHTYGGDLLVVSTGPRASKFGEALGYDRHVTGRITTLGVEGGHSEMHRQQAKPIGQALGRYVV